MAFLSPPPKAQRYLDVSALPADGNDTRAVSRARCLLRQMDAKLRADFDNNGDIACLVQARAWAVNEVVAALWRHFIHQGVGEHKNRDDLALVAVGGFGRGELHPYSDIDLLILTNRDEPERRAAIGRFIQALWDTGLTVGHATRTPAECRRQAKADVTVATSLMESRLIQGEPELFERMQALTGPECIWPGDAFFAAKLAEQKQRHLRHGGTAYNLEPNIKEGPGGLRDIQMVGWVAHRHFKTRSLHGLVDAGFLEKSEYLALQEGQRWLWKLRFALHHLAGRAEERLLFDHQQHLARHFGYTDDGQRNRAVEQFMQAYYRWAMRLERLNHRLLQLFDENILQSGRPSRSRLLDEDFMVINHFLEARDPAVFQRRPASWFQVFLHLQNNPSIRGIRASTVRAMRRHIDQVGQDSFRNDPGIQQQFLAILKHPNRVTEQLLRMNRLGILGRYLPPWRHIIGRMQYDLFHVYTVDQHNLFVLRNLRLLATGKSGLSFAEEQMRQVSTPHVLYLAALFHDIAKGRGGSHVVLGAADARDFAQQHRLPPDEADMLEWLVRHHLVFSTTAQKKDLSDPGVIRRFAAVVGNESRLRALYLLTIADIAGTDPKLWNDFKDSLMRELFIKTQAVLSRRAETDLVRLRAANRQAVKDLLQASPVPGWESFVRHLPDHVFSRYSPEKVASIARLVLAETGGPAGRKQPVVHFAPHDNGLYELLVYAPDHPGVFYHIARALQSSGYNVMEARVSSTADGHALDVFICQPGAQASPADTVAGVVLAMLERPTEEAPSKHYVSRRLRHFHIAPEIDIKAYDNNPEEHVMEVACSDRPGLLADIAGVLLRHKAEIHGAKIATFGNRVEDTFWISAEKGRRLSAACIQNIITDLEKALNEPR